MEKILWTQERHKKIQFTDLEFFIYQKQERNLQNYLMSVFHKIAVAKKTKLKITHIKELRQKPNLKNLLEKTIIALNRKLVDKKTKQIILIS